MVTLKVLSLCQGAHVTREDGARVRRAIEEHWNDPQPVTLDFAGVSIASISFFDESIGLIAKAKGSEALKAHVRVENISDGDRALLNRIVQSRVNEREPQTGAAVGLLAAVGVPVAVLEQWDGTLLALYQDHSGHSHSLTVATEEAREKSARGDWTLDLGSYALGLPREVGRALKADLDALGVNYARRSLGRDWLRAQRRSAP